MTVERDADLNGQWGDGKNGVPRKRAQFAVLPHRNPPYFATYKFSMLFPKEWDFVGNNTTVFSLHHVNADNPARGAAPLDAIVQGDKLRWIIRPTSDGAQNKVLSEKIIVPDMWYDFTLYYRAHVQYGAANLMMNGALLFSYNGPTVEAADKGIYMKIGPYVWREFPVGVNYRRMYVQVN